MRCEVAGGEIGRGGLSVVASAMAFITRSSWGRFRESGWAGLQARRWGGWIGVWLGVWLGLVGSTRVLQAQGERLELGKRLRRFEVAWEKGSAAQREASAKPMQQAVNLFFGLQLERAMEQLDEAWRCVETPVLTETLGGMVRLQIEQDRRLIGIAADGGAVEVMVKLVPSYGGTVAVPAKGVEVQWEILGERGEKLMEHRGEWEEATVGCRLTIPGGEEGDFQIGCRIIEGESQINLMPNRLAVVRNLDARLTEVEGFYQESKGDEGVARMARATLGEALGYLRAMAKKIPQEIEYPGAELLRFCEGIKAHREDFSRWIGEVARQQDCWLTLVEEKSRIAVRVRAPENREGPLPVLFLMHGAGGSENMFFETYGAGRAVEEGLKRGWLVVAPRLGFAGPGLDCGPMLKVLEESFSIDRERIFMIGHSMGAGQVVRQVTLDPKLPKAVAALGGGAMPGKLGETSLVPWFVAAGELDFGKRSAMQLREALRQSQAPRLEYREYAGIEHMVIVQAALDDVFAYFDKQLELVSGQK